LTTSINGQGPDAQRDAAAGPRHGGTVLALAVGALLAAAAAQAQVAADASDSIAEVVVTAQKRTESLQSVPVSVTALTSAQLGELKIDSPSDIVTQIPNLQVNGVNGEGSPIFSLRGVSMIDYSLSQSSPVASYMDEVYKGNVVLFGVELYDLERIEVLRGPQGTLYGKNSTGGAINFITKKPGFDTEGDIKVGTGNYGRKEAEGAFQTALAPDRVAMRFAFTYTSVDGFMHNVLPGYPDMEGVNQWGMRLSLLFRVNDDLDAVLRLSKSKQDPVDYAIIAGNIGAGDQPWGPYPPTTTGIAGTGYYRTLSGMAGGVPLANDQVAQDYTPHREQSNDAAALTVNWKLSQALSLTAITSLDDGSLFNPDNTDGAPLDVFKIPYYGDTHQFTQDLRLTTTDDGPFQFIGGAYYQHELIWNSTENQLLNSYDAATGTFVTGAAEQALTYQNCAATSFSQGGYIPNQSAADGLPVGYASVENAGCRYFNSFDQIRNSWAVYTDDSYALSKLVKLRAGLRYTNENAEQKNALDQLRGADEVPIANLGFFQQQSTVINGVPVSWYGPVEALPGSPNYASIVGATRSQSLHNTAVTGHAGVDVTPTDDVLLYASYSRGFRAGAFNAQFLFTPTDFTTVKPETVDSYEVGFKTAWFEHRLQVDGAAFHYAYQNQQLIDVEPDGSQPLINLPRSKIDGGELEVVGRPVHPLTLRLGLGLLDARVQEGYITDGTVNVAGHQLPQAPHLSATFGADWDAFALAGGHVVLHADGSYASKQYFELLNEDRIAQDPYALLNARLSWHGRDDKWEVGFWDKNITNRFYLTNAYDLQALGWDYLHRGLPREFGVDVGYHF
jgi:iron complex outermembrane receptor protein